MAVLFDRCHANRLRLLGDVLQGIAVLFDRMESLITAKNPFGCK